MSGESAEVSARFRLDRIRPVLVEPWHVRFQVAYWIDECVQGPCLIGGRVDVVENSGFSCTPAGRLPDGVPHGYVRLEDGVALDLRYDGERPYPSRRVELFIYDSAGRVMTSAVFTWGQAWRRRVVAAPGFKLEALEQVEPADSRVPSDEVALAVRYEVPWNDDRAFFIGASLPGGESDFEMVPAGDTPFGIPKGACDFDARVALRLFYVGTEPTTTEALEVFVYTSDQTVVSERFNYVHQWIPKRSSSSSIPTR